MHVHVVPLLMSASASGMRNPLSRDNRRCLIFRMGLPTGLCVAAVLGSTGYAHPHRLGQCRIVAGARMRRSAWSGCWTRSGARRRTATLSPAIARLDEMVVAVKNGTSGYCRALRCSTVPVSYRYHDEVIIPVKDLDRSLFNADAAHSAPPSSPRHSRPTTSDATLRVRPGRTSACNIHHELATLTRRATGDAASAVQPDLLTGP